MKISKLRDLLEIIMEEHGDLEVVEHGGQIDGQEYLFELNGEDLMLIEEDDEKKLGISTWKGRELFVDGINC